MTSALTLPWTPQREKASGNNLLPRKQATSLTSPLCCLYHGLAFLTLSFPESYTNTLTSPTLLLWTIHDHSHKYLYQLSSTCEQKPIGKIQHIYARNSHETVKLRHFLPTHTLLNIYQALIVPYLTYGLTVWRQACKSYLDKLLKLQKRALRVIYFSDHNEHAIPLLLTLISYR